MSAVPFSPFGLDLFGDPVRPKNRGALAGRFEFPPFSVLNARDGEWQERKRAWMAIGIRGEAGRGDGGRAFGQDLMRGEHIIGELGNQRDDATGTSIFDPVLCELMYRWFCPPGGSVLDPFGGESVKGIVSAALGYAYTGIELRAEQVEVNRAQAAAIGYEPTYINGDSARLESICPPGALYDFVWTSPPYFDLEEYGGGEEDGSGFADYGQFMLWYSSIFQQAAGRLRDDRFLAVKVGEIRDKKTGGYRNFVGDNITCMMRDCGLAYYNEIILVTPVGSLPVRTGKQFEAARKVGKTHQNILVFYKGDPRHVSKKWPRGNA